MMTRWTAAARTRSTAWGQLPPRRTSVCGVERTHNLGLETRYIERRHRRACVQRRRERERESGFYHVKLSLSTAQIAQRCILYERPCVVLVIGVKLQ